MISPRYSTRLRVAFPYQYHKSTCSVCSLFKLLSIAMRIHSGSLRNSRVPSDLRLMPNLVARKIYQVHESTISTSQCLTKYFPHHACRSGRTTWQSDLRCLHTRLQYPSWCSRARRGDRRLSNATRRLQADRREGLHWPEVISRPTVLLRGL